MEEIFQAFCAFGGGMKETVALMDGAKFSKFCRDTKLLDKKLTAIDVDIIFAQVKQKHERKINFEQFQEALKLMAEKKYYPERDPLPQLEAKIMEAKGPSVSGTTKSLKTEAVDRMTDTSRYTGTHKERFDSLGKGRGMEGRDSNAKGRGSIPTLTSSQVGYVGGYKNEGTYQATPSPKQKKRDSSLAESVTERLTDTSKYTGSHKHRFDESGRGKGMAGRDLPMKGPGMAAGSVASQAAYVHGYKNEGTYGKN